MDWDKMLKKKIINEYKLGMKNLNTKDNFYYSINKSNVTSEVSRKLKIKRYYPFQDLEFLRMNINGQTFGQESSFHNDYPDESYASLLIFTEPEWNQEWGGQFVVRLGPGQYETIPYIPNRGVIFTPCNDHKGFAPSRHCPIMRTTIVFFYKLHPQNQ